MTSQELWENVVLSIVGGSLEMFAEEGASPKEVAYYATKIMEEHEKLFGDDDHAEYFA